MQATPQCVIPRRHPRGAGCTDVGLVRSANEDSFLVDDTLGLYAVADGIGGDRAGEIASVVAVQSVREFVRRWRAENPDPPYTIEIAEQAVDLACREVHRLGKTIPTCQGMATTLTLLLIDGRRAVAGHVGSSRLHVVRDRRVHQLTQDHTVVAELVAAGAITAEAARRHFFRRRLSRSVGYYPTVDVETFETQLVPGDRIVLCTDGLNLALPAAVRSGVLEGDDLEQVAIKLLREARVAGGQDNATVVVVDPVGCGPPCFGEDDEPVCIHQAAPGL
jgi:protein phosphatase